MTFPVAVTLTRFAVPRWVRILGTGWLLNFFFMMLGVLGVLRMRAVLVFLRVFLLRRELGRTRRRCTRGQDHEHIFSSETRLALDRCNRRHIFGHAIQ